MKNTLQRVLNREFSNHTYKFMNILQRNIRNAKTYASTSNARSKGPTGFAVGCTGTRYHRSIDCLFKLFDSIQKESNTFRNIPQIFVSGNAAFPGADFNAKRTSSQAHDFQPGHVNQRTMCKIIRPSQLSQPVPKQLNVLVQSISKQILGTSIFGVVVSSLPKPPFKKARAHSI